MPVQNRRLHSLGVGTESSRGFVLRHIWKIVNSLNSHWLKGDKKFLHLNNKQS